MTPSLPVLRPALPEDAEKVAELCVELGYKVTPEEARERIVDALGDPERESYVAEVEGNVVGWVHVQIVRTLTSEPHAEVTGLVVGEGHRSGGIGALLLDEAAAWAVIQGSETLRLRANVTRERAHGFYERHGFRMVKQQKVFEKSL